MSKHKKIIYILILTFFISFPSFAKAEVDLVSCVDDTDIINTGEVLTFTANWSGLGETVKLLISTNQDFLNCNYDTTSGCLCASDPNTSSPVTCSYQPSVAGEVTWYGQICDSLGNCDSLVGGGGGTSDVIEVQIGNDADDGFDRTDGYFGNSNGIHFWEHSSGIYNGFMLWENIVIPDEAIIDEAYMILNRYYSSGSPEANIYFEDSSSPFAPTSHTEAQNSLGNLTSVENTVAFNGAMISGESQTNSIVNIIDELMDNHSYAAGANMLAWFIGQEASGQNTAYDYDSDINLSPKLYIKYTIAGETSATGSFTVNDIDADPPVITDVSISSITANSATITWTTDELSTSQVIYGASEENLNLSTIVESNKIINHTVSLSGLVQSTNYYYRVKSKDNSGNEAISESIYIFTTLTPGQLSVSFIPPTPVNNTVLDISGVNIVASVSSELESSSFINWDNSLVGYWNFEDDVYDQTGNGNDGILIGDPQYVIDGFGKALQLDGDGDYIKVLNSSDFELQEFTLEARVKNIGSDSGYKWLLGNYYWSHGYMLRYSGDALFFEGGNGSFSSFCSTQISRGDRWYHIAATFKEGEQKLYVDGQLADSSNLSLALTYQYHKPLWIGGGSGDLQGSIDEVRIWNRVLSEQEVKASYSSTVNSLSNSFNNLVDGTYSYYAFTVDTSGETDQTEARAVIISTSGDITQPVISNINSYNIAANSATISWTTDEPSTSQIEYGPTTNYGLTAINNELKTTHIITLAGLSEETTYYFKVVSKDNVSNESESQSNPFITLTSAITQETTMVTYYTDWDESANGQQVESIEVYRGQAEIINSETFRWYSVKGTKVSGDTYQIWFLANSNPFDPDTRRNITIARYIIQEGSEQPLEYIEKNRSDEQIKALLPKFHFMEEFLPTGEINTGLYFFESGNYMGHPLVKSYTSKSSLIGPPSGIKELIMDTEMIIGQNNNKKFNFYWSKETTYSTGDKVSPVDRVDIYERDFYWECTSPGESGLVEPLWPTSTGATILDGTVEWTCRDAKFIEEDYQEMIEAGTNYFQVNSSQEEWVRREAVFYDLSNGLFSDEASLIRFPEIFYRSNFDGGDMFPDEITQNKNIWFGGYPQDCSPQEAARIIEGHTFKLENAMEFRDRLEDQGINLGDLQLPDTYGFIWDVWIEGDFYALEAGFEGIVSECINWTTPVKSIGTINYFYGSNSDNYDVYISPVTWEKSYILEYSQVRGIARYFDVPWGMSVYSWAKTVPDIRLDAMKLAYDMGSTYFLYWSSSDSWAPYDEALEFTRDLIAYANSKPSRNMNELVQAADTVIVIPYGYGFPGVNFQGGMFGNDTFKITKRINEHGIYYIDVLAPAAYKVEEYLENNTPFDLATAIDGFTGEGYSTVVWIKEDGTEPQINGEPLLGYTKSHTNAYWLDADPILDGNIDNDSAWQDIFYTNDSFTVLGSGVPDGPATVADKQSYFKVGYTEDALWFGIKNIEPDASQLTQEDTTEIFIMPKDEETWYQFTVNSSGSKLSKLNDITESFVQWTRECWLNEYSVDIPYNKWQAAVYKNEETGYWSVEIKIPYEVLLNNPKEQDIWKINIGRNIKAGEDATTTWARIWSLHCNKHTDNALGAPVSLIIVTTTPVFKSPNLSASLPSSLKGLFLHLHHLPLTLPWKLSQLKLID